MEEDPIEEKPRGDQTAMVVSERDIMFILCFFAL